MTKHLLFLSLIAFTLASCNSDGLSNDDFRSEYIGTYTATKSSGGFDSPFGTDIADVIIGFAGQNGSTITYDQIELELNEDGTTGLQLVDGYFYNLTFEDGGFKLVTFPDVLGDAIACYIQGEQQ